MPSRVSRSSKPPVSNINAAGNDNHYVFMGSGLGDNWRFFQSAAFSRKNMIACTSIFLLGSNQKPEPQGRFFPNVGVDLLTTLVRV